MGDGGERGYEKVLEASGAPVHVWVRAGLSVHRASRQAILYLNGCPAQRPVSSHGHCRLWLPHTGLRGGRLRPGSPRREEGKDNKGGRSLSVSVRPDGAGGPRGLGLCAPGPSDSHKSSIRLKAPLKF